MQNLTNNEQATMLAALRFWQENFSTKRQGNKPAIAVPERFKSYFAFWEPLSEEEIDQLCEKINESD